MLRLPQLSGQLLLPSPFLRLLTGLRPFSAATPSPSPPAHFMVDYLICSCGLSRTDAVKASKRLAHLKSPEKPDAVLRLLKETGLRDAHISRLVRSSPAILVADPKKTLEPKIRALQEAGFSQSELAQLVLANPNALRFRNVLPTIEFWRKMLGNNEKLLKIAENTHLMGGCKVDEKVDLILSFLRTVGMSDDEIARIVVRRPRLISSTLNKVMSTVERVKSLGITPGSRMFMMALSTVSSLSQTTLEAKSKLLRSYGWSEAELLLAFQGFPGMFTFSEKKISRAMDFLLNEAGCRPSYVARHSVLLSFSIDKRLMPRYYVLQFLKKKRLPGGDRDLYAVMTVPEEKFVEKYVAPISEHVPEMLEMYPKISAMGIAV